MKNKNAVSTPREENQLVNLKKLSLWDNQISKIEGLDKLLKKLPQIKLINLWNNPLNEKSLEEIKQIQQEHSEINIYY
ncbi:MAG: hypothetical protein PHU54_02605 [Candidatus Omnitrophica bacterium]|nr:hypothetical protein [Candidatus Omnitrophota bacterium]